MDNEANTCGGYSSNIPNCYTKCGTAFLCGGYNCFGSGAYVEQSYTNILAHYQLKLTFDFFRIDTYLKIIIFMFIIFNNRWDHENL